MSLLDWIGSGAKTVGGDVSSWLGLDTPEFGYSSEELREKWRQPGVYQTPGGLGQYYGAAQLSRARGRGVSSPAEMRQRQALGMALERGAAQRGAATRAMGAPGALRAGLMAQQQGGREALARYGQERSIEQAKATQDYINYLKAKSQEQLAQERIDAAYTQLNLQALLAEQEARRKQKGGIFGGIGGLIGSIFS